MRKGNSPRRARQQPARRLKLATLLLFSLFVSVTVAPRMIGTSASSKSAVPQGNVASPPNLEPEFNPVRFKRVGVGQRITFGLSVIDEESDDVRVELIQKPPSAKYNEKTLTVDWTPQKADGRAGMFTVRIMEFDRATNLPSRTLLKTFSISIEPQPVELPHVPPAPVAVETLISITDPERLQVANAQWPITAMFDRIAAIEASKQVKPDNNIAPTNGAQLFRDSLKNLALLHRNEEIDPDSARFNRQFNAENWRLIMVRPRMNKKVFELRLVYRNEAAAEPVYLMPRMRIIRGKDAGRPDEDRQKNNETFARLFYESFFDGSDLKPGMAKDKRVYAEALAQFITKIVTYNDPADPKMQANFAALPHNARLGGDDQLDAKGNYLRGNGWALGVMKVVPVERNGRKVLAFANMPIDGFATSVKPNPQGTAYVPVPAPRFNPKSAEFVAGWDKLIDADDHGNVAIPDEQTSPPVAAIIDASSFSRLFKERLMVQETSLKDPRRRLFEERGMTCIQCHVRNFDEGDYLNAAVRDPKAGQGFGKTNDIPRLFFVLTPDEERSEFFRRNEEEQVGNLKGVLRDYLKVNVNLDSPLSQSWPHNTRVGRS
ncbi:MAG TPA: hypothetical protein VJS44_20115 [Pyrinomonadaceae bacterium]|nr:hypothetical protein [Pyrinomonadaceae bacterium]